MRPKKVAVITGGLGFIGSRLAWRVSRQYKKLVIIDNLHTGSKWRPIPENAEVLYGRAGDMIWDVEEAEVVFHLGMPSSSPMYKERPQLVGDVVHEMINILEWARDRKARVVLASTSSLYNYNPTPWREDMPTRVADYYTEARYYCERLCELYSKLHGVKCVALRLFSVFGEGEQYKGRYANVITQMIWAALAKKPFTIYDDGYQSRDLIYVGDVAEAFARAAEIPLERFEVVNVGSGCAYTFLDMMRMLADYGLYVRARFVPNPIKNYVYYTLADTRKMRKMLGLKPRPVRDVLPQVIEYYKELWERGELNVPEDL